MKTMLAMAMCGMSGALTLCAVLTDCALLGIGAGWALNVALDFCVHELAEKPVDNDEY